MGMEEDMRTLGAEMLGVMVVVLIASTTESAMLTGIALGLMTTLAMGVSGAHLNPAITIAQMAMQKMEVEDGLKYLGAQIAGAFGGLLIFAHVYSGTVEIPTNTAANDIWLDIAGMMVAMLFFTIVWNATVGEGTVDGFGGMVVGAFSWLMIEATDVTMNAAPHFAESILTTSLDFSTFWMFWLATALGSLMAFWMWDEIMGEDEDKSYSEE
ncbi:MAG TPA: hypothetical protein EYN46_06560 [Candidatus Poseidoniales archaeon]|nr:MAG: hypothetical protein CXX80_12045 [Euryarchaeota archaeon]HIA39506.1 hypothetical protein [Candidatus Poseidoniales archaeon]PXY75943.1 MAG: hypothetical protein CXX80_03565 [Euryarchaeota archaeon]PXY77241.1 MAG: hypothetical protein CXX80_01180 [Euryarchaeota archaeon]HIA90372.1 hypothetical protein [Candidatus Poseidoniales archaeon]